MVFMTTGRHGYIAIAIAIYIVILSLVTASFSKQELDSHVYISHEKSDNSIVIFIIINNIIDIISGLCLIRSFLPMTSDTDTDKSKQHCMSTFGFAIQACTLSFSVVIFGSDCSEYHCFYYVTPLEISIFIKIIILFAFLAVLAIILIMYIVCILIYFCCDDKHIPKICRNFLNLSSKNNKNQHACEHVSNHSSSAPKQNEGDEHIIEIPVLKRSVSCTV